MINDIENKFQVSLTFSISLKSYFADRYFQIYNDSAVSDVAVIRMGVPRDGMLSPVLFNIFFFILQTN